MAEKKVIVTRRDVLKGSGAAAGTLAVADLLGMPENPGWSINLPPLLQGTQPKTVTSGGSDMVFCIDRDHGFRMVKASRPDEVLFSRRNASSYDVRANAQGGADIVVSIPTLDGNINMFHGHTGDAMLKRIGYSGYNPEQIHLLEGKLPNGELVNSFICTLEVEGGSRWVYYGLEEKRQSAQAQQVAKSVLAEAKEKKWDSAQIKEEGLKRGLRIDQDKNGVVQIDSVSKIQSQVEEVKAKGIHTGQQMLMILQKDTDSKYEKAKQLHTQNPLTNPDPGEKIDWSKYLRTKTKESLQYDGEDGLKAVIKDVLTIKLLPQLVSQLSAVNNEKDTAKRQRAFKKLAEGARSLNIDTTVIQSIEDGSATNEELLAAAVEFGTLVNPDSDFWSNIPILSLGTGVISVEAVTDNGTIYIGTREKDPFHEGNEIAFCTDGQFGIDQYDYPSLHINGLSTYLDTQVDAFVDSMHMSPDPQGGVYITYRSTNPQGVTITHQARALSQNFGPGGTPLTCIWSRAIPQIKPGYKLTSASDRFGVQLTGEINSQDGAIDVIRPKQNDHYPDTRATSDEYTQVDVPGTPVGPVRDFTLQQDGNKVYALVALQDQSDENAPVEYDKIPIPLPENNLYLPIIAAAGMVTYGMGRFFERRSRGLRRMIQPESNVFTWIKHKITH